MIQTLLRALTQKRGTGYIHGELPSGTQHIDQLIGTMAMASPPSSASVASALVLPKDQIATNSCVGQSAAQGFRIACLARGIPCPDLSALFPYKLGRALMGVSSIDAGMTFSALLTSSARFGFASEALCPFSMLGVNANPTASAYHDGYDRRGVRGYYYIDPDDTDRVRKAIYARVPVLGAWFVDDDFTNSALSSLIDKPRDDARILGSHAMVCDGYNADGSFNLLNHYGMSWRDGGRCRFTTSYMKAASALIAMDVQGA